MCRNFLKYPQYITLQKSVRGGIELFHADRMMSRADMTTLEFVIRKMSCKQAYTLIRTL
jgi:hypothetical protein